MSTDHNVQKMLIYTIVEICESCTPVKYLALMHCAEKLTVKKLCLFYFLDENLFYSLYFVRYSDFDYIRILNC